MERIKTLLDLISEAKRPEAKELIERILEERSRRDQEMARESAQARLAALNMMEDAVLAKQKLELTQFALDHAADPAFWINEDASLSYVNEAACRSLGYSRDELLRMKITDIDPEVDEKRWKELWDAVQSKGSIHVESRHHRKDGHTFPVEVHSNTMTFQGKTCQFAFTHDITNRKQTDEKLRASETQYRNLFENMTTGFALHEMIFDETGRPADYRFLQINPAFEQLTGLKAKDILGRTVKELMPDTEPFWIETYGKVARTGEPAAFENYSQAFKKHFSIRAFRPSPGRFATIFNDITQRETAKAERLRLSTAIEQSPETVVITDTAGTIEYVNPAFETITGYSRQEAIGKNPRILKSGQHDTAFYSHLWKTIAAGNVWGGRLINKRKNGELYTEEAAISPVRASDGTITGYVSVKRDITQELIKEEKFRQSQKMEAVGQLAGGIAHDFNNILQAILGFSELLTARLSKESQEHHHAEEIHKSAKRAADLTRHLLAFSRKQPMEKVRMDINAAIHDTEVLLQLLLGDKTQCVFNPGPDLWRVYADHSQITQIIMNLAVNARDAMPDGGRMTIATENISFDPQTAAALPDAEPGDFVCLSITDTGCGMSREVKEHLFEPFFTTKEVGRGTGLGLSVVYGIVKQSKGWIHVYSEEGKGTSMRIYLPASDPSAQEESADQTHNGRILLVEDDPNTREMVIRILNTAGYATVAVGSAEEAAGLFNRENGRFDMLFSDMTLPAGSGLELADMLREQHTDLPVLLYSGYQDQRERWKNLDIKGYHFLQKPFTLVSLLAAVHETLAEGVR